jgi:cystathionine beta-lyase/cystathionine gamma-synthase
MEGFGGMVRFELVADAEGTARFTDRLRTIKLATSLGGVTTLANQSITNTHASLSERERREAGISPSLIRLSVGLEPAEELIDDLRQALDGLSA